MIGNSCGANTVARGVAENVYSTLSVRGHREMPKSVFQATHSSRVVVKPALNAFRHMNIRSKNKIREDISTRVQHATKNQPERT